MFGFRNKGRKAPPAMEVLRRISVEQTVVRMEVERVLLRFNTRISLRDQVVLVGKPAGVEGRIATGDLTRFKVPWDRNFEVRMEVMALHVNLKNDSHGFVCKSPTGGAFPVQRGWERFNTRRYSNVQLHIPSTGLDFPVMDLSSGGCRIKARSKIAEDVFKMNRKIMNGVIRIGDRFHIQLESLTPRMKSVQQVGLEFSVRKQSGPQRELKTLLGFLAAQELELLASHSA